MRILGRNFGKGGAAAAQAAPQEPIPSTGPMGVTSATAQAATAESEKVTAFLERGVVGTPIVSGFVTELGEYDSKLYGIAANRVYEKMRRGDAQVDATLTTLKLPILSGYGSVEPAGNTPLDKEIAEFVEDSLFGGLEFRGPAGQLVSQSWDSVLQNALLMLDFGAAAHEDCWAVDGDYVRLKMCAERLPLTFYRFLVDVDGHTLVALQQYGYRGNDYVNVDVPAWKLAMFTYRKEGANFYGRSVLRAAYKHWFLKEQLYKIDAIACERNGLGVPWIGYQDANAAKMSTEEKEAAFNFVTKLASHQSTGIYTPPGVLFKLIGVTGQVRNCHDSILHHNEMISKTALAMFMDQGQASQGNRALGVSMQDFFFVAAQSVANQIAATITHSTVRRLVDFNFDVGGAKGKSTPTGPGAKASGYPVLKAPQVQYVKLADVVDALSKLAAFNVDLVHPDGDIEEYLRRKMGLPEAKTPRTRFAPTAIRVQDNTMSPAAPAKAGLAQPEQPQKDAVQGAAQAASGPAGKAPAAPGAIAASEGAVTHQGVRVRRAPRGAEVHLALNEIASGLDDGKAKVAAALRGAKAAVVAEALHKAMGAGAGRAHQVSVATDPKLVAAILDVLRPVKAAGRGHVYQERNAQLAGKPPRNPVSGKVVAADANDGADDDLGLYAQAAAGQFNNNLTQRAVNRALKVKKNPGDASKGQAIVDAQDDLGEAPDGWIDRLAGEAANEAYSAGRSQGFGELADEIDHGVYSSLLDINTCDRCAEDDGKEGPMNELPDTPNPDCDGGDQCRCVQIAVFKDEEPSNK